MTKLQIYLIVFALVATVLGGVWLHGYITGTDNQKLKYLEEATNITEARNEIANNRPDDAATIARLLAGTF